MGRLLGLGAGVVEEVNVGDEGEVVVLARPRWHERDRLKRWLEPRSTGFTNRARLDRLLRLMQLQLNDLADVDAYTVAIRDWLMANHGCPVGQRRAIIDGDRPSLLSQAALGARRTRETRAA